LIDSTRRCVQCFVAGRVQGVWYRATTQRKATALGLDGWVSNLPDGRVEVVAAGSAAAIAELCGWLWEGSPAAIVTAVAVVDYTEPVPEAGFATR
jgi:acylphosphatase